MLSLSIKILLMKNISCYIRIDANNHFLSWILYLIFFSSCFILNIRFKVILMKTIYWVWTKKLTRFIQEVKQINNILLFQMISIRYFLLIITYLYLEWKFRVFNIQKALIKFIKYYLKGKIWFVLLFLLYEQAYLVSFLVDRHSGGRSTVKSSRFLLFQQWKR